MGLFKHFTVCSEVEIHATTDKIWQFFLDMEEEGENLKRLLEEG
jgi:hypothetical protein